MGQKYHFSAIMLIFSQVASDRRAFMDLRPQGAAWCFFFRYGVPPSPYYSSNDEIRKMKIFEFIIASLSSIGQTLVLAIQISESNRVIPFRG